MQIHNTKGNYINKKRKRLGRGRSSGLGKTCGRGTKGQKSRSGHKKLPPFFEGGQMPLVQRLPKKRGFKKIKRLSWEIVNIGKLNQFKNNSEISKELMFREKLIKSPKSLVKVLGDGELNKKLSIRADAYSSGAKDKIRKAGGQIKTSNITKEGLTSSDTSIKKVKKKK